MTILVCKVRFEVLAYSQIGETYRVQIPALDFLRDQCGNNDVGGSAKGFFSLFQRYADNGTSKLTTELFHEVDNNEKIFEFIKGRLRIFCFKDGNIIVLTHGALKKSNKVDPQEIAKAVAIKNKYFALKG